MTGPGLLEMLRATREYTPIEMFEHFTRQYGEVVHLSTGLKHNIIFTNPDHIHEILVTHADKFSRTDRARKVGSYLLGNGIVLTHGEFHKRQRRLMQPAFHMKRIETYHQLIVDHTQQTLESWKTDQTLDILTEMSELTATVVTRSLFGADLHQFKTVILPALDEVNQIVAAQMNALLPRWCYPARNRRLDDLIQVIDDLIQGIIAARRATNEDSGDLLSMLLLAQDEGTNEQMTDRQVRDEVMTLFVAGHKTTATALTWAFYLISQHPQVEACLLEELDTVLKGETPTLQDLKNLPYLDMVIKETMRLYPPLWVFSRKAIEDVDIQGYHLKKGASVIISPYLTQNSARYFPEPSRFDPSRFAPGNNIHKFAYFPFGGGPTTCIGNSFALMEIATVLAMALQRFRLVPTGGDVKPKATTTLQPATRLLMKVDRRL